MTNFTESDTVSGVLGTPYFFNTLVALVVVVITFAGYRHIYSLVDFSEASEPWMSDSKFAYPPEWMEDIDSIPRLRRRAEKAREAYFKDKESASKLPQRKSLLIKRVMAALPWYEVVREEMQGVEPMVRFGYVSDKIQKRLDRDLKSAMNEIRASQEEAEQLEPGFGNGVIQQAIPLIQHERKKELEKLRSSRTAALQDIRQKQAEGRHGDHPAKAHANAAMIRRSVNDIMGSDGIAAKASASAPKKELTAEEERAIMRQAKVASSSRKPRRR